MSHNSLTDIQWARITPDKVVVATANRTWLHQLDPTRSDDPFAQQMVVSAGSVETTRRLLEGAVASAYRAVSPSSEPPTLSPRRWVWRLVGSYHLNRCTPQLLEEASQGFAKAGRKTLAQWAAQKAVEEEGHDELALLDIKSMGYDIEAVVAKLLPPAAKALVNYFTSCVQSPDPIGCVGYAYTMERLAMNVAEEYIQKVEALLPPGVQATRCLRVHSSVGYEVEHVKDTVEMVAGLDPLERARVVAACYETGLLCFSPPKEGYISEEELCHVLKPLERTLANV